MPEVRSIESGAQRIRSHSVHIECRELMSVTGVKDVLSFNDQTVSLITDGGELNVEGMGLHITRLNLDDGQVVIAGQISALDYDDPPEPRGSMFSRMFR